MKVDWRQLARAMNMGTSSRRRRGSQELLLAMVAMAMKWLVRRHLRSSKATPDEADSLTRTNVGTTMSNDRLAEFAREELTRQNLIAAFDAQLDEIDHNIEKQKKQVDKVRQKLKGIDRRLSMRQIFGSSSSRFVLVVATLALGAAMAFILAHLITGSLHLSALAVIAIQLWLVLLARSYLYSPGDTLLLAKQASVQAELNPHEESLQSMTQRRFKLVTQRSVEQGKLNELKRKIAQYREALLNSAERMALLQLDWKSLRAIDFERYLEKVFRSLGYDAQLQGRAGDQGVDLLVNVGGQRWAIQAKGYEGAVSNSAVQEIVAGMNHYRCTHCAVITNSSFTRSARELAESNTCLLVDGELLGELLHGRIPAFPLAYRPSAAANRQASAGDT